MPYRFSLEPYKGIKTRFICPNCQHKNKTFSRYIDTETGEYLNNNVGRCNRENSCGYHYSPKEYFRDKNILPKYNVDCSKQKIVLPEDRPASFVPFHIFKESLTAYNENNFIKFLIKLFGTEITNDLTGKYFIGTSSYWPGSTVFWQIDISRKIRTGKIMLYNSFTGSRLKKPFTCIQWMHKANKIAQFNLRQCLFGEHLLNDQTKSIAIVESEKTAIIASKYIPEYIWLASGGINNINEQNCNILKNKKVIFFPDIGGYKKWNDQLNKLSNSLNFSVSNLLEISCGKYNLEIGDDIADYLIKNCYHTND